MQFSCPPLWETVMNATTFWPALPLSLLVYCSQVQLISELTRYYLSLMLNYQNNVFLLWLHSKVLKKNFVSELQSTNVCMVWFKKLCSSRLLNIVWISSCSIFMYICFWCKLAKQMSKFFLFCKSLVLLICIINTFHVWCRKPYTMDKIEEEFFSIFSCSCRQYWILNYAGHSSRHGILSSAKKSENKEHKMTSSVFTEGT